MIKKKNKINIKLLIIKLNAFDLSKNIIFLLFRKITLLKNVILTKI